MNKLTVANLCFCAADLLKASCTLHTKYVLKMYNIVHCTAEMHDVVQHGLIRKLQCRVKELDS